MKMNLKKYITVSFLALMLFITGCGKVAQETGSGGGDSYTPPVENPAPTENPVPTTNPTPTPSIVYTVDNDARIPLTWDVSPSGNSPFEYKTDNFFEINLTQGGTMVIRKVRVAIVDSYDTTDPGKVIHNWYDPQSALLSRGDPTIPAGHTMVIDYLVKLTNGAENYPFLHMGRVNPAGKREYNYASYTNPTQLIATGPGTSNPTYNAVWFTFGGTNYTGSGTTGEYAARIQTVEQVNDPTYGTYYRVRQYVSFDIDGIINCYDYTSYNWGTGYYALMKGSAGIINGHSYYGSAFNIKWRDYRDVPSPSQPELAWNQHDFGTIGTGLVKVIQIEGSGF